MKNILYQDSFVPFKTHFKHFFRVMKLTVILLFFCISGLFATETAAQTASVSINVKNSSTKSVILEIEKQTDYLFVYNEKEVDLNRLVTLSASKKTVAEVLKKVFSQTDVVFIMEGGNIMLMKKGSVNNNQATSQKKRVVTGTVTDAQGEVIIGATVLVEGTDKGAITDISGTFSLGNVSEKEMITISYMGYLSQKVSTKGELPLRITLTEDAQTLEEVVVVGYGTKKKINLTGAIASVDGKALLQSPTANLSNAMAGRMPGVIAVNKDGAPGSGSNLSIRGSSTLNNNSPLIVVDGVPRDSFNAFDPNEVESITVLKDGAAAAIYGARANNGVFLVTTKRGRKEKMSINYSGTVSLQNPTMYPDVLNAYQYAITSNQGLDNAGYDRNNPTHASRYYTDKAIERYRTGEDGGDWYNASFRKNSMMQNHNVTVNGGSDVLKYFLSLGLLDQDGMYDNISYKAYKFRSNVDATLFKILTLGVNLEGRYEKSDSPYYGAGTIFQHATRLNPIFKQYHPSGRPVNTGGEHSVEEIRSSGYNNKEHNTFQGTATMHLNLDGITKGLSANGNASVGKYYTFRKAFNTPYTMYSENEAGEVIGKKSTGGIGGKTALTEEFYQNYTVFLNLGLNYQRTFGKHDVSGLFVYEQNSGFNDSFNGTKNDFSINSKDEMFVSGPTNQTLIGSSGILDARRAYVARLGYIYDSKYLFEASFRCDGSYKFPKEKRYGFFPAVSAAWRISEESFMKENSSLSFISNLKLRASFAQVGNDKVNAFQYQDSYTISSSSGPFFNNTPQTSVSYGVYPNANITWETANNFNIGLDGDLWNGLLGFELDYFIKDTKDILWSRVRSVPDTFGRSLPNENYARVKNQGFEATLSHHNRINKLDYTLRLTASCAKNKVTQIDDPSNALDYQKQINRPMGFIAGYKSLGLFQSQEEANNWMGGTQFGNPTVAGDIKYADIDGNKIIDSKDQMVLSNNNNTPRVMFGLAGDMKWKSFDFSFLLQGAAERNIMLTMNSRAFDTGCNAYAYLLDAWSPDNKDAKYPLLWTGPRSNNNRDSDFWLKDASYLRLKTITLGYTLPISLLNRVSISSLRLFVSGQNLLTFSGLEGFDPEVGSGNGAYYPQQKLFSVGINVNF